MPPTNAPKPKEAPANSEASKNQASARNGSAETTRSFASSHCERVTGRNNTVGSVPCWISMPSSSAAAIATNSGNRKAMLDSSDSAGTWKPETMKNPYTSNTPGA